MRKFQSLVLAFGLIWCLPADTAVGQLIRIFNNGGGGVDIRVPFVHIQTDGFGGSYVRAPFVQVHTPTPFYPGQPNYGQPGQRFYRQPGQSYYGQRGQPYNIQPGRPTYAQQPSVNGYAPAYTPGQSVGGRTTNRNSIPGAASVPPSVLTDPNVQPNPNRGPEVAVPASPNARTRSELKSVLDVQGESTGVLGLRQRLVASARDLDQSLSARGSD